MVYGTLQKSYCYNICKCKVPPLKEGEAVGMGRLALKIWENQYETIKKIPKKSQREKLALAILDYAFTGKHEKLEYPLDVIIQSMYIGLTLKNQGGAPTGNKNNRYTTVVQPLYNPCTNVDTTSEQPLLEIRNKKIENKNNKEIYKESFEEFWKLFPKQRAGSKEKAYTSYCRAIKEKRATQEGLLEAVEKYSQSDLVKNGYAKGCAAWLNDDRFNDEYKSTEHNLDWI